MNTIHEMLEAIKEGNLATIKKLLSANTVLASARDDTGDSALLLAIYNGNPDIIKLLLAHNPHINFFEAVALGDITRIQGFLEEYPELATAYSHDGFTALHLAAFFNQPEAVKLLLRYQADVNAAAKNETIAPHATPLHSAAARGNTRVAEMLLNAGAHVNSVQQGGFSALHAAVLNNNKELVELLLKHHANIYLSTDNGKTALSIAKEKNLDSIIALLQHH